MGLPFCWQVAMPSSTAPGDLQQRDNLNVHLFQGGDLNSDVLHCFIVSQLGSGGKIPWNYAEKTLLVKVFFLKKCVAWMYTRIYLDDVRPTWFRTSIKHCLAEKTPSSDAGSAWLIAKFYQKKLKIRCHFVWLNILMIDLSRSLQWGFFLRWVMSCGKVSGTFCWKEAHWNSSTRSSSWNNLGISEWCATRERQQHFESHRTPRSAKRTCWPCENDVLAANHRFTLVKNRTSKGWGKLQKTKRRHTPKGLKATTFVNVAYCCAFTELVP